MGVMVGTEARAIPVPLPGRWTFWADRFDPANEPGQPPNFLPVGPVQAHRFLCHWKLNDFARGEIGLLVNDLQMEREQMLRLWSWRVWAYYDADDGRGPQPVWCGVPDGVADDGGAAIDFTLAELPGYLRRRQFDPPDNEPKRYEQIEQTVIAAELAAPLADVGVDIETSYEGEGFKRDRTYAALESESRGNLLANLAGVIDGVQFRSEYYSVNALPRCRLAIRWPRVGVDHELQAAVPGNAIAYRAKWDADMMRTRTYAVGEAPDREEGQEGEPPKPMKMVDRPQPGIPRLDYVDDWPGVKLETTLQERAESNATTYASPVLELSISVREAAPWLGTYGVGDTATALIVSPFLPDGLEITGQLTELYINARENAMQWTLSVVIPPAQPRQTLIAQLAALRRLTTGIFRQRF
jgi:hypothetical protein